MPGTRFADVRWFGSIDSTNRYLLDEARRGAPEGVVAVADHQQAGKGRLGRRWTAPSGANLLASVLLRPDLPADQRHLASVVVALAAADAVASEAGVAAGIKWPNDLLASSGRKLAGVLAEADLPAPGQAPTAGRGASPAIVVGIGLNVAWPGPDDVLPPDLVDRATSLRLERGAPTDRAALLDALLDALEPRVADLGTAEGRRGQADDLRARCVTLGTMVRVELPGERFEGRAVDVTDAGHLVVDTEGGARSVVAGDVVHVRPSG